MNTEPQRGYKNKAEMFRHKAEQARELADKKHRELAAALIAACELEAKKGLYSYSSNGSLQAATIKALKEEGFQVEHGSQYNESYYTISW